VLAVERHYGTRRREWGSSTERREGEPVGVVQARRSHGNRPPVPPHRVEPGRPWRQNMCSEVTDAVLTLIRPTPSTRPRSRLQLDPRAVPRRPGRAASPTPLASPRGSQPPTNLIASSGSLPGGDERRPGLTRAPGRGRRLAELARRRPHVRRPRTARRPRARIGIRSQHAAARLRDGADAWPEV